MAQQSDLLKLVRSTTLSDLQSMIAARGKLDKLLEKKSALLKDISAIDQEITSIEKSLGRPTSTKTKAPSTTHKKSPATRKKRTRGKGAKRGSQPSMQSLIAEILREKNRPLSVNEIADALLNEKNYKTTSRNFKHQLRVMLSLNKKGWFKKLGSGMYTSAEGKAPAPEKGVVKGKKTVAKKKPSSKKKATSKKAAPPKIRAVTKKTSTPKKTAPAKPKPVKRALPRKIVQPSIESLIADVLREKKKPMTVYEIAGALLNEKKYQTTSKKFDVQIRILLSKNKKGLFTKLGAGKFGLA